MSVCFPLCFSRLVISFFLTCTNCCFRSSSCFQQSRFGDLSRSISGKMDEMGTRLDELERSIGELMAQAGLQPTTSASAAAMAASASSSKPASAQQPGATSGTTLPDRQQGPKPPPLSPSQGRPRGAGLSSMPATASAATAGNNSKSPGRSSSPARSADQIFEI